jgi:hypothetical protein
MGPNKVTSLEWGQWDLNPAGKWVQLHPLFLFYKGYRIYFYYPSC